MNHNSFAGRKLLVAAMLASAGAALPQVAIAQQADTTSVSNTEIIVTAQRREEKAQDVPIVITAVSAEGLRERSITDLQGMQNQIPSLIVAPNGQSTRDTMSPTIRGQGASFQGAPGVVVYMNEVPLIAGYSINSQGGPGNFVDLQNVQVLSGVQGTLFGRNTTGGAMLLTAAKPTDKLEGYLSGGFGNYNLVELEAVVNVPVSDTLAVRLVGASRDRDGFTQDVNWNKDRDDTHWRMGRVGVQWNPTDTISSYTMAQYGYSKTNGTSSITEAFNYTLFTTYQLCSIPGFCSDLEALVDKQKTFGPRKIASGIDSFMKNETWSVMNSTDFEVTSDIKLRNIVSYAEMKTFYANDQDGTVANIYNIGNTVLSRSAPKEHHKLFTEELQLQGEALDKKLNYTVGGFYAKQSPKSTMKDFSTNVCPTPGEAGSVACAGYREYRVYNESKALFAQATLDLGVLSPALENLRLTGGYRHTWDSVGGSTVGFGPYNGKTVGGVSGLTSCNTTPGNLPIAEAYSECSFSKDLKSDAGNWLIGLDYQPIDNLLLYAKVTRGYKAGGFNSYAVNAVYQTFGPEFVTDYEAGFKSDLTLAGRPVRFNVNAYNMDYSKIQRGMADRNDAGKSGAAMVSTGVARIRGVEIDTMFKPVDAVEIGGNYSYIDAKYKSFKFRSPTAIFDCDSQTGDPLTQRTVPGDTDAAIADLTCIPLQYLSPHIFSVYGRVQLPVPESAGEVSLFVNYAWRDKQHTSPANLEKFPNGDVWEPGVVLASYGVLSANLTWKDFLQSGLEVSAFGTNLTNKTYKISNGGTFNSVGAQTVMYGEPRMYGIRLKYAFGN